MQNTVYTDDVLEANFTGIENAMTHMSLDSAYAVQCGSVFEFDHLVHFQCFSKDMDCIYNDFYRFLLSKLSKT